MTSWRKESAPAVVALVAALAVISPAAGAPAKPPRLLVPVGATVLYWNYSMPLTSRAHYGTIKITNPTIISRVREMINAIPVAHNFANRACPDDMMVPDIVRFSTASVAASFTEVEFQLGGCPHATVFQHGIAQRPALGGSSLPRLYAEIQREISPQGQPLA